MGTVRQVAGGVWGGKRCDAILRLIDQALAECDRDAQGGAPPPPTK